MRNFKSVFTTAVVACLLLPAGSLARVPQGQRSYSGNVFYFGGPRGADATNFTLTITSLTPPDEVDKIVSTLKSDGQNGLMKFIGKQKRGYLQVGTQLARDVNAVWITDEPEGRKITVVFERWLGWAEVRAGARSLDYPFTYMEIFLDQKGKGEGTLIPAAKVRAKSADSLEVENFAIYPARLTNVKLDKN